MVEYGLESGSTQDGLMSLPRLRAIRDGSLVDILDGPDPQEAYKQVLSGARLTRHDDGSVSLLRMSDIVHVNRKRSVLGVGLPSIGEVRHR
jgi:hypothetical protein